MLAERVASANGGENEMKLSTFEQIMKLNEIDITSFVGQLAHNWPTKAKM